MKSSCDIVTERIALGESLGDVAEHASSCERCQRLVALPVELGVVHSEVDPGLGFTARMTAGAQHRIAVRRRRRITGSIACAVAASVAGVLLLTHQPEEASTSIGTRPAPAVQAPANDTNPGEVDPDVQQLVNLATTYDGAVHVRADWKSIEKPLAPYRELLEGKIEP